MKGVIIFSFLFLMVVIMVSSVFASTESFRYSIDSIELLNSDIDDIFLVKVILIDPLGQTIKGDISINNLGQPSPYLFSLFLGEGEDREQYIGFLHGKFGYSEPSPGPLGPIFYTFNIEGTFTLEEVNDKDKIIQGAISTIIKADDKDGFFYSDFEETESMIRFFKIMPEKTDVTDLETRLTLLESWKETIEDTIQDILDDITDLFTKTDDHWDRIKILENHTHEGDPGVDNPFPSYLNYLSSSSRKKMVCGYAEDNKLDHIEELGYTCDLTYRTSRSGRESVRCRCQRV